MSFYIKPLRSLGATGRGHKLLKTEGLFGRYALEYNVLLLWCQPHYFSTTVVRVNTRKDLYAVNKILSFCTANNIKFRIFSPEVW